MDESFMLHVMLNAAFASPFTSNILLLRMVHRDWDFVCQLLMLSQCASLCVCISVHMCVTFPWFTEAYCNQSETVLVSPSVLVTSSFESDIWTLLRNSGLALPWQQIKRYLRRHMFLGVVPSTHVLQPLALRIQCTALYLNIDDQIRR